MTYVLPLRMAVSEAGRGVLAVAVTLDRDWSLPASAVDTLIEAVSRLDEHDLDAAALLARHLDEAIDCVKIRRAMAAREASPADPVEEGEPAQATAGSPPDPALPDLTDGLPAHADRCFEHGRADHGHVGWYTAIGGHYFVFDQELTTYVEDGVELAEHPA